MTRHTVDSITSDALDALYDELAALRAVARGYCPACGRGDAAPTVEHWEQQRDRADRAEAALADMTRDRDRRQWYRDDALRKVRIHGQRADRAEAALARVRHVADLVQAGAPWTANHDDLARRIRDAAAVDGTPATGHVYLSTGCFHGDHDYCKSMTGLNGAKRPASCKKCGAKCICSCHGAEEPATPPEPVHCPCNGVHFPSLDNCRWCKCHRTTARPAPVSAAAEATDTTKEQQ